MIEVPDYVEPLRGYRVWCFEPKDTYLRSTVVRGATWHVNHRKAAKCYCNANISHWLLNSQIFVKHMHSLQSRRESGFRLPPVTENHIRGGHVCGIHAASSIENLVNWANYAIDTEFGGHIVVGEVDLWGKVAEHEFGYRAQYARIRKLYKCHGKDFGFQVNPYHQAKVESYGILYKVPVEILEKTPPFWTVFLDGRNRIKAVHMLGMKIVSDGILRHVLA